MAIDVYDDSIHYLDRQLGFAFDGAERTGIARRHLDHRCVDHGEHLGDHRLFSHGCSLYRQLVGVPLLIIDRKIVPSGRVVSEPVTLATFPQPWSTYWGSKMARRFPDNRSAVAFGTKGKPQQLAVANPYS